MGMASDDTGKRLYPVTMVWEYPSTCATIVYVGIYSYILLELFSVCLP